MRRPCLACKADFSYHNHREPQSFPSLPPPEPALKPPRKSTAREPEVVETEGVEPEAPEALDDETEVSPPVELKASGTSLARSDPLRAYMAEVSRHPLLSREEELELAQLYARTGDRDAAWKLVTANLRLVVKIAREYHRGVFQLLDLIQEGNVGLMQAVKKFDPLKGVKLSTYAAWWIRAYIIRFIMDNWRQVKLGTTQAQRKLFYRLKREQDRMIKSGFTPDTKLLADRIDVTEKEVVEMQQRLSSPEASLDSTNPTTGRTLMDTLEVVTASPEDLVAGEELRGQIRQAMVEFRAILNEREREIWDARIAIDQPETFQTMGERLGITRQRVQQVEQRLKDKFKDFLKERIPEADEHLTF